MMSVPSAIRRAIQRLLLVIAAGSAAWSAWLALFGGFSSTIAGFTVRSHDPVRPLFTALAALALLVPVVGFDISKRWTAQWIAWLAHFRHLAHVVAAALAVTVAVTGIVRGSKAAGGSDQYGYVSQAQLWSDGRVVVWQPWVKDVPWPRAAWTFAPLGYVPARDSAAIVPTYSPGLPMLMAVAQRIGGTCGAFWVVPLCGGLMVLATYLLGVRLGSSWLGLMAAVLVATSPPFLMHQLTSMSDVPVAAAIAIGCWFMLGVTLRSAAGAAIAFAIAVIIRPNMVLPMLAFLPWLATRIWRDTLRRSLHIGRAAIVIAGLGAGVLTTLTIFWTLYGSPFESGYGPTSMYFGIDHIVPNARNYAQWFVETQTPLALLGVAALFIPMNALWPDPIDRPAVSMSGLFVAATVIEFLCYLVLDDSSYLRFLLPCYPFVMIGLSAVVQAAARVLRQRQMPAATAALMLLAAFGAHKSIAEWHVFGLGPGEGAYVDVAEYVRAATPENSVVLAMQHSGNVRYFGGRVTLRWDEMPPEWLDRGISWMAERGVRTYALLDPSEVEMMKRRFAGQSAMKVLAAPPVFRFGDKFFYDFGRPPGSRVVTKIFDASVLTARCVAPLPQPTLIWHNP